MVADEEARTEARSVAAAAALAKTSKTKGQRYSEGPSTSRSTKPKKIDPTYAPDDNAVDVPEEEDDDLEDMAVDDEEEEEEEPAETDSEFIDDSQADFVANGYGGDDDDSEGPSGSRPPPRKARRRVPKPVSSDSGIDENALTDIEDLANSVSNLNLDADSLKKVKKVYESKWGATIDISRKSEESKKLAARDPIGTKYHVGNGIFIWAEYRTLESDKSKNNGGRRSRYGKRKVGHDNKFINVIVAREYTCSRSGLEKLFEFNIPLNQAEGVADGIHACLTELIRRDIY